MDDEPRGKSIGQEIEEIARKLAELVEACRRQFESYLEDEEMMAREAWRRALVDATLPYDDFVAEYGEPMQYVKDFSPSLN